MFKKLFFLFCFLSCILVFTTSAHATDVTLQWNTVAEANGYKVYWGETSRDYLTPKDVENKTTYTIVIPTINDDKQWFFAVTAYNNYGESDYSEEVDSTITGQHTVPLSPVIIALTFKYDNGDVVVFDYEKRTATTTKADGSVTTLKF